MVLEVCCKINEHYIDSIMKEERHQFIYGYNGIEREQLLKDITKKYAVQLDNSNPIGIYLDSIGLPIIDKVNCNLTSIERSIALYNLSRDYLNLSIEKSILDATLEQLSKKDLNERSIELLRIINLTCNNKNIKSLED